MRSIHSLPGHDEPQVVEVPDLRAGPGQVLIQTLAAAVNPVDVFVATDAGRGAVNAGERLGLEHLHRVAGSRRAGTVDAGHVDLVADHAQGAALPDGRDPVHAGRSTREPL